MPTLKQRRIPATLDLEAIKAIIPQRFPFLMLDRVIEIVPGERVIGVKNLSGNEWFYQGHFPEKAITPGAMILESVAQAGIIFFHFYLPERRQDVTYLLGSAKIRFLEPVFPGSQLKITITPIRLTSKAGILSGEVSVEGCIVVRGEFALGTKPNDAW